MHLLHHALEGLRSPQLPVSSEAGSYMVSTSVPPHCPLDRTAALVKRETLIYSKTLVSSSTIGAKFDPLLTRHTALLNPPRICLFAHSFFPYCALAVVPGPVMSR